MYQIALCENDREDLQRIKTLLERASRELQFSYQLTDYSSGEQFLNFMRPYLYDIAVFDIEMNKISGIEAAKKLRDVDKKVKIIFTTIHKENVFSSFYAEPLQYFIKPVKYEEFKEILLKATEDIRARKSQVFAFCFNNLLYSVPISDILYFESRKRIVNVVTISETLSFYGKLDELENQALLHSFIRCSQSFLINPEYIKTISNTAVTLSNSKVLPVSRGKYKQIKEHFMKHVAGLLS